MTDDEIWKKLTGRDEPAPAIPELPAPLVECRDPVTGETFRARLICHYPMINGTFRCE